MSSLGLGLGYRTCALSRYHYHQNYGNVFINYLIDLKSLELIFRLIEKYLAAQLIGRCLFWSSITKTQVS